MLYFSSIYNNYKTVDLFYDTHTDVDLYDDTCTVDNMMIVYYRFI